MADKIAAGPTQIADALDYAIQAAQGLEAAHRKGVVHRDIKPHNLMVDDESSSHHLLKIMDFELAQLSGRSKLTKMGTTMGSVAYMSPEQAQGNHVDHRTDVWALGVVLYQMITAQLPFRGEFDQAIVYSIINEDPEPLTSLRAGVPMDLEWIVSKALDRETEARYQSAEAMLVDLRSLAKRLDSGKSRISTRTVSASVAGLAAATPAVPAAPSPSGAVTQLVQPETRGPAAAWTNLSLREKGLIAALVVTLVLLGFFGVRPTPPPPQPELPVRTFALAPGVSESTLRSSHQTANTSRS